MNLRRTLARLLVALHLIAATGSLLHAQHTTRTDALDSAIAARRHYSSARDALRAGDPRGAQRMLERAMNAWPGQSAYASSLATIAARNGAGTIVAGALTRLAMLESGNDVIADTAILSMAARDAAVAGAHQRLRHAIRPQPASQLLHQLSDSALFPEGIAHDARSGAYYVTSIRHRTIVEISRDGTERAVLPPSQRTLGAMMSVRVDSDGAHLWATMAGLATMKGFTDADSSLTALLRIRIADGAIVDRWEFGKGTRHVPGDLAIAPNGDVFVSDSHMPLLFLLRKGSRQVDTISHPYFRSLQGLAITPDGEFLFVADYSHGLLRVRLADASVAPVSHADTISTLGLDGISLHGSNLIAIQNGNAPARVVRFALDPSGATITAAHTLDRRPDIADEPTNGVVVGNDFVYIANSQWEKYDASGNRIEHRALHPPRLLRVPLGSPTRPPG